MMFAEDSNGVTRQPDSAERLLAEAERAARGGRRRLASMVDLFLPDTMRLSDYQRATVRRFMARLVGTIERDIRQRLTEAHAEHFSEDLLVLLGSEHSAIALPVLERARALRDPELVALLIARVEEHRITERLRKVAAANGEASALIEALMADSDPILSGAAERLLVAESRRCYIFEDRALPRSDLPADLHYRLLWCVTAALRDFMVRTHDVEPGLADSILTDVGTIALAEYDESEILEAAAMALAQLLGVRGWLDDQLLQAACTEARLALLIAMLAVRAGMDFDGVREMLLLPNGDQLLLLLKALDVGRETAAVILFAMDKDDRFVNAMISFDTLDRERAAAAIRPWRIHPGYRAALSALSSGLSERGDGWAP